MAFLYFLEEEADPIILETGMGGRLDATNIVQPLVSVITNISRDHQEHLGDGLLAIAGEKAGIIKPGAPLVTYATPEIGPGPLPPPLPGSGRASISGRRRLQDPGPGPRGRSIITAWQQELPGLDPEPAGPPPVSQCRSGPGGAGTLGTSAVSPCAEAAIREGLAETRWPGRLEQVPQDRRILLDGAHNPAAALTLAQTLKQTRGNGRLILVMGIMADKDVDIILARLLPLAQMVIFTQPQYFRAATTADLARRAAPYDLEVLQVPRVAAGHPTGPVPGRSRRPHRHHRLSVHRGGGQGIFCRSWSVRPDAPPAGILKPNRRVRQDAP